MGINRAGERDVLGLWVGTGGEGAKGWMTYLAELKNRGMADVCIACCDCEDDQALSRAAA